MLTAEAIEATGGLSDPSKMPGYSWGISALRCITGSKLRQKKGSTCSLCYALRGHYVKFKGVRRAHERRLRAYQKNPRRWIEGMVRLISTRKEPYFRWFDAGDLQSVQMLRDIVEVCQRTPKTNHWLPTRELGILREWRTAGGVEPSNLCIRISSPFIDGPACLGAAKALGVQLSSVATSDTVYPEAANCPARHQNNECGDCRSCWNKETKHVVYHKH